MDEHVPLAQNLGLIPLFPLPNVVLFPRAVLPLHIFEERYKLMTADVLDGAARIAMALLRPGWEKSYYAKPEIDPVVCVGTILTHERLPDGKYNFLLQGVARARVVREKSVDKPYRVAELETLVESSAMEIDLDAQRQRLVGLFMTGVLASASLSTQFRQLLSGPWPTAHIADLIAFSYFEDVELKQALLSDVDVCRRVRRIVAEVERLAPAVAGSAATLHPPNMN